MIITSLLKYSASGYGDFPSTLVKEFDQDIDEMMTITDKV